MTLPKDAWSALQQQARAPVGALAEMFAQDPRRAQDFAAEGSGLYLDYSKQRISRKALQGLLDLAAERQLRPWIDRLFAGEPVNNTESRAALHMALRAPESAAFAVAGRPVMAEVHEVRERMRRFAQQVRDGRWRGYSERRITDVVNIGIGGSDLGPRMVCEALQDFADGPRCHFVANVDATQIAGLLKHLDPATSLFIITSKTFTTQETMANAQVARAWFLRSAEESDIARHFVAVSTHRAAVEAFGIGAGNMFEFWDWVGGRYSLWSAVGLSILLALGDEQWQALHSGAYAMDEHFRTAPFVHNLPVLMGLLAVWNRDFLGCASQVIVPYAQRLERFVGWLQQLEMESNGKSVQRDGTPCIVGTTPALWGDVGSNSQHAFFQMLHQGAAIHPVDFILPVEPTHALASQHRLLIANCLAQSAALMLGKGADQVRAELETRGLHGAALEAAIPHRVFAGNRPSSTLLLPRLDAYHLGALLALYEHRTFVQSVIWNINPFDQWGVELGKKLAADILEAAQSGSDQGLDASTRQLLARTLG
jgi:glucose-6-phosphate isomerase